MIDFTAYNPTKVRFGSGVVPLHLTDDLGEYRHALIIIGSGSVKRLGILGSVTSLLDGIDMKYTLFEGIQPNPTVQAADAALTLCRKNGCDVILAIGGGSVIDTSKVVSVAAGTQSKCWELIQRQVTPEASIPLYCILTLAATGTEMNSAAVLQSAEHEVKRGWSHPLAYPKVSYLDPAYTLSVSKEQTANGLSDLVAHALEIFFGSDTHPLVDYFACAVVKRAFEIAPLLIEDLHNLELRKEMMWMATVALNGTLSAGKKSGDWGVHSFEHSISFVTDIAHGRGLAAIYPQWLAFFQTDIQSKLDLLCKQLGPALCPTDFVTSLRTFYSSIGLPDRFSQLGYAESTKQRIIENALKNRVRGVYFPMDLHTYEALVA